MIQSPTTRIFTLVHGTFATRAAWTRFRSPLAKVLRESFNEPVIIRRLAWSGRNTFSARAKAAERLRQHIRRTGRQHPTALHYLIGHSHAGNVILMALAASDVLEMVSGVTCLSTPFLHVRKRRWSALSKSVLPLGAAVGVFLAYYGLFKSIVRPLDLVSPFAGPLERVLRFVTAHDDYLGSGLMLLLAAALVPVISRGRKAFREFSESECKLQRDVFLIIRTPADEASGALGLLHFVSWVIGRCWRPLAKLLDFMSIPLLRRSHDGRSEMRWVPSQLVTCAFWVCVLFVAVAVIIGAVHWFLPGFLDQEHYSSLYSTLNYCMRYPMFVLLAPVAGAGIYFAMLLPFAAAIAGLALFFGPEYAMNVFEYDVSAEPTPSGVWEIHQLPIASVSLDESSLLHSTPGDSRVPSIIVDWVLRLEQVRRKPSSSRLID
jgi:hypothetical protein